MICVQELTKRFGAHTALDRVSIEVARGECLALVGPNGSGKTTLLKCLAGLVHPTSGMLSIEGTRAAVSYLPQQAGFPEHLRAGEVVDFYRRLRGLPESRTAEVINLLDCAAFSGRPVSELSGGMRQRLAIAVVCLPAAPVLLLDEPTASLDPHSAARFRDVLARFKAEGATIVLATHVLADVDAIADTVATLIDGSLAEPPRRNDVRYLHAEDLARRSTRTDDRLRIDAAQAC